MTINERQLDYIMNWARDRDAPFTVKDLQLYANVHYQTAYGWIRDMERTGYLERLPMRAAGSRSDQFVLLKGEVGDLQNRADLKLRRGQASISPAFWATTHINATDMASVAYAVLYLFTRSYYNDAPDHQHLRGTVTPVAVRAFIASRLKELEKDIEIVRQLLSFRVLFDEGSEFAQRFGIPAEGFDMLQATEAARVFLQVFESINIDSTSPPVGE